MGNSQTSLNKELSHVKLPENRRCEGGSLSLPDLTVRVLAYPSQPTFNNSVEAPFMYRVQLSYIREELANGIASIEPASCCMKSYRRLVIQLPETSLATVAEFNRAIQESS